MPMMLTVCVCVVYSVERYHELPGGSEVDDNKELDKLVSQ